MHRTIIVDDDMIVRMYLKDVIQWDTYGFTVVGIARDGEEALDMVHRMEPDVILTDISMPRMDGIELIRRLRAEGYDGVIDVLTCHDDFELVKSAMQQGADDYLLKNYLSDTTMGEILAKISEQLQKRSHKSDQRDEMEMLARKGIDVVRREFLEGILRGEEMSKEAFQEQMRQAQLHGAYRRLAVVMLQPTRADRKQINELLTLCTQWMENEAADILLLHKDILVLLIDLSDIPSVAQSMEIIARLERIVTRLAQQYLNLEVSMASSAICDRKNAIADALRQANETLQNSFYGAGRWRYGAESRLSETLPPKAEQFQEKLRSWLEAGEEEILRQNYAEALREIQMARVYSGVVLAWFRRCDHIAGIQRSENQYSEMTHFSKFQDRVEEYITHWRANRLRAIPEDISPSMRHAAQFLQQHFNEPIGLNDVAQEAGLSPTYFSTLFKQEMGVGFSEYLLTLRLERVCVRLRTTRQTIKQISQEAGFADYSYFCRIFKKNLGISPAAYRKTAE